MKLHEVIKKPLVTEKSTILREVSNQYFFEVNRFANKFQIKAAVEKFFGVSVTKVHTLNRPGKYKKFGKNVGKTADVKKAVVTLQQGNKIDLFEGA